MSLTPEQKASFERDGYIIVSGLFEKEQIEAARQEIEMITYGKSFVEYLSDHQSGLCQPKHSADSRIQFPIGSPALDSLIENDRYLDCLADCLGTDEMTYCNAHLFVRSGPDDTRHASSPWQGYHIDDDTCSFLPPHPDVTRYAYINSWVFLHDIEADGAPLHVLPGSHRQLEAIMPRLVDAGDGLHGQFCDITKIAEIDELVPAVGQAGDVLLYSSYLVHGAVGFANKNKQRAVWTISMGRAENDGWTKFNQAYSYADRQYSIPFWSRTTPRVRSLFGWPPPGDAYYTPHTLNLLAAWFPGIDLEPYHAYVPMEASHSPSSR